MAICHAFGMTTAPATIDSSVFQHLQRVIAVVNDKGGVGKTTISANTAGQLAAAGYRVLLIDLNRQANLADDLGYRRQAGIDDQGAGLLQALLAGTPLQPVAGVRDNLWVVPGGTALGDLTPVIASRFQTNGRSAFLALARSLAPIAPQFDVIGVDTPPENVTLVDLALAAARWIVMPTKSDAGGLVGMQLVSERFALAREINPTIGLLGVVLFATGTNSKAIHRTVRENVERAFGIGASPMFSTFIRHSEATASQTRARGLLAHELEVAAANQPAWWQALRDRSTAGPRISSTVALVSGDFQLLAGEILDALANAEKVVS